MRQAAKAATAVLRGILCIGFAVQAALGILWMCLNIREPQEFAGEWGILYCAFQGLGGECPQILCVIQLGIGFFAGCVFLRTLRPGKKILNRGGSLALLTFPMALQCHLSIAPYSLVSSLFLLELSALIPGTVRGQDFAVYFRGLAKGGCCWFFLTLLLPEYFLLGAVPLALALLLGLRDLIRRPRSLGLALLLLAAVGGMTAGTCALSGDRCLPDRETMAFSLFHRITWPTLWADWVVWPQEAQDAVGYDAMWAGTERPDAAAEYIRPRMLEQFGSERAVEYYSELSEISWNRHKSWIMRKVAADALGYCATPLILPLQLAGRGYDSYTGRNYELMAMCTPRLTKYYVGYSCRWFLILLIVSICLALSVYAEKRGKIRGPWMRAVLLCLLWAGAITVAYTLRGAGRMDYKATVGINLLWLAGAWLLYCRTGRAEGTENPESPEKP